MVGRTCTLEKLDVARHAAALSAAYSEAPDGRDWTYLFAERPTTPEAWRQFFEYNAAPRDPYYYAIIDHRTGLAVGLSAYMPMYFELIVGLSSSRAGFAQTALATGITLGGLLMGRLIAHLPRPKRLAVPLLCVAIVLLLVLVFAVQRMPIALVLVFLSAIGFALGPMFPLTTVSTQNAVDRGHLGVVMATLNLLRSIGGALGSAVYGAILLSGSQTGSHAALSSLSPTALAENYALVFAGVALAVVFSMIAIAPMEQRTLR